MMKITCLLFVASIASSALASQIMGTSDDKNVFFPADGAFVIIMEQDGDRINYFVRDASDRLEENRR